MSPERIYVTGYGVPDTLSVISTLSMVRLSFKWNLRVRVCLFKSRISILCLNVYDSNLFSKSKNKSFKRIWNWDDNNSQYILRKNTNNNI